MKPILFTSYKDFGLETYLCLICLKDWCLFWINIYWSDFPGRTSISLNLTAGLPVVSFYITIYRLSIYIQLCDKMKFYPWYQRLFN